MLIRPFKTIQRTIPDTTNTGQSYPERNSKEWLPLHALISPGLEPCSGYIRLRVIKVISKAKLLEWIIQSKCFFLENYNMHVFITIAKKILKHQEKRAYICYFVYVFNERSFLNAKFYSCKSEFTIVRLKKWALNCTSEKVSTQLYVCRSEHSIVHLQKWVLNCTSAKVSSQLYVC